MNLRKPYITRAHVIVEIISLVLIIGALIYCVFFAGSVEGPIPTHYNLKGEVDGYGSAKTLTILPLIMLGCNLLIAACVHLLPKRMWNMPVKVRPENSNQVYKDTVWMMVLMELEIAIFTAFESISAIRMSEHHSFIFIIIWTIAVFATIAFFWVLIVKHNRR